MPGWREVARTVLPVGIYSSMYATCNARALMNFLSLRRRSEASTFPSFPQQEIEMVADWRHLLPRFGLRSVRGEEIAQCACHYLGLATVLWSHVAKAA